MIDTITKGAINVNTISKILSESAETEEELVFSFEVQNIDGCSDEKDNTLSKDVQINSQPPLPKSITD